MKTQRSMFLAMQYTRYGHTLYNLIRWMTRLTTLCKLDLIRQREAFLERAYCVPQYRGQEIVSSTGPLGAVGIVLLTLIPGPEDWTVLAVLYGLPSDVANASAVIVRAIQPVTQTTHITRHVTKVTTVTFHSTAQR